MLGWAGPDLYQWRGGELAAAWAAIAAAACVFAARLIPKTRDLLPEPLPY